MKFCWWARGIIAVLLLWVSAAASGSTNFEAIADLPAGEQYRQLSLMLLISGGAEPALVESLVSLLPRESGAAVASAQDAAQASPEFDPDQYKTPLARIVDQRSMLAGAAVLFRFTRDSGARIRSRLATINANNPVLISMVDMTSITEDAIIIRNAIADSIGYSNLAIQPGIDGHLQDYRTRTIVIRNMMEYESYIEELGHLTDEAILSVGGKLDAYQRMFDEEVDSKEFDRHFDAAESLYKRTDKFDERAGILTEEIMNQVILLESQVDP